MWWAGLSQQQQDWLIANAYDRLGDLRGLPATAADAINRMRLADDKACALATLASAAELGARWRAMSPQERANAQDPATMLVRAQLMLDNVIGIEKALGQQIPGDPPALLLTYNSQDYARHGRASIAYGNPDTADNTAILVPGTGRSLANWPNSDARHLYTASIKADPDATFAAIVDLSYQPPAKLFPDALADHYAQDGNANLRDDITSYEIAHQFATGQNGHTTLIAHSYGTYTAGLALHHGLTVDDVVLIGSPGTGVSTRKDLHLGTDHVFVGLSDGDPIHWGDSWFVPANGYPPDDPEFGATSMGVDNHGKHSEYFDDGSESLQNMAKIATGQAPSITHAHK